MRAAVCRRILPLLLPTLMLVAGRAGAASTPESRVWQLTPYRVQVLMAVEPRIELSGPWTTDLQAQLQARIESLVGGLWQAQIVPAPAALQETMLDGLDVVRAEQLPVDKADKILLLVLSRSGGDYSAAACEFDVHTATLGTEVRCRAASPGKLADASIRALWKAFAALAMIQQVDRDRVTLRVRGSALAPRDRRLTLLAQGDALRPVVRFNQPDGSPKRLVRLPQTLLAVKSVEAAKTQTRLLSAVPVALAGARGVLSEPLALKVVASDRPTRVVVQTGADPARPVASCDLVGQGPVGPAQSLARTDGQGTALLSGAGPAIQELRAQRGDERLAQVPLVVGEQASVVLKVPDHSKLLAAQGVLAGLCDELVDVLTLRDVLLSRAQAQVKARQWAEAKATLAELEGLTTRDKFVHRLIVEKQRVGSGDPIEQAQIESRFAQAKATAEKYLTPEPITKLASEIKAAGN